MKSFIAASVATIAVAANLPNRAEATEVSVTPDLESKFQHWIAKHGRNFPTVAEYIFRRALFVLRDRAIRTHNSNPSKSWTMDHNHMSDLTESEYKAMLGGRFFPAPEEATEEVGSSCVDSNGSCPAWAAAGECNRNPGYMIPNCKKSCNQCNPSPPKPTCVDLNNECS
jgi:hypothetical protein